MTSAYANSDNALRPSDPPVPATPAVIYMRMGSPGRAETDDSVAAQREACLRKAREMGFSLIDEYTDPNARLWRRAETPAVPTHARAAPPTVEKQQPGREFAARDQRGAEPSGPRADCTGSSV